MIAQSKGKTNALVAFDDSRRSSCDGRRVCGAVSGSFVGAAECPLG